MKKFIYLGLMTVLVNVAYCQQKGSLSNGTNQDEVAIQKVLTDLGIAFDKRDLAAFTSHFVNSPALYYQICTTTHQVYMAQGWEAMTHMVGGYMKEHPEPNQGSSGSPNPQMHINGNTAWITQGGSGNLPGEGQTMFHYFYVMEKQPGNGSTPTWKVAAFTSQQYKEGQQIVVK